MKFKNLKIRTKLLTGFGAVLVVLMTIGLIGYHGLNTVGTQLDEIATNRLPAIDALLVIKEGQTTIKALERALLVDNYPVPNFRKDQYPQIEEAWNKIDKARKVYESLDHTPQEKTAWNEYVISFNDWKTSMPEFISLNKDEDQIIDQTDTKNDKLMGNEKAIICEKLKELSKNNRPLFFKSSDNLDKVLKINEDLSSDIQISAKKIVKSQDILLIVFISGGIILALLISLIIASMISKPIKKMDEVAKKMAEGDLNIEFEVESKDEIGSLAGSFKALISVTNGIIEKAKLVAEGDLTVILTKRSDKDELIIALSLMVTRLSEVVGQIMEGAINISSASTQFSSSTVQIAQGANEQAASAEEVSSSIEQMNSNIQQNTENAIQTERIARNTAQGIVDVNTASQKSLEATRQIADKIKVINAIAEKTDILAINAAIEAARAGEHGKGFAVVAAEVRKLAETSQKAAIEINNLSTISLKVTEEAGNLMKEIIPEIQKTATLIQEITAASSEQSSGVTQIAKAIEQLSQVTQQNSAASEEISSTAEELASQAESLKDTVSFFKTANAISPVKFKKADFLSVHPADRRKISQVKINMAREPKGKGDEEFVSY